MKLNNSSKISLTFLALFFFQVSSAQNSWVFFKDKCANQDFFSAPICDHYLEQISNSGITIHGKSKWLNAAFISDQDINKIKKFEFVSSIESASPLSVVEEKMNEDFSYGEGDWQLEMLNLDSFHRKGFTGKGVRFALFDAGFFKVDSLAIFDSLWMNNQIYATRDFVTNDTLTFRNSTHGMVVLAIAGINVPDSMVGAAPGANFMLVRTEEAGRERHVEEYNWLNAMEWADSVGVDLIHSSLGYSLFDSLEGDYTYADMDGASTIITIAAELAASRGIFITNSAGNSGASQWKFITAPCDGRNVLCVGAVDSFEMKAGFSSFGPSADGRVKPDVMAMGRRTTIPNEFGTFVRSNGTSLSGPIVAGLVACLMEAHPASNNAQIFDAIVQSADRYNAPDSGYGYGIPDVLVADSLLTAWGPASVIQSSSIETFIYPNPNQGTLKVRCEPGSNYTIYDIQGRMVQEGRLANWINFIDLNRQQNGTFVIDITYENEISTRKKIQLLR